MDLSWNESLHQSPISPSTETFGYGWISLYLLIGFGLGLPNSEWLLLNLVLSLLWLVVYNGYHNIHAGFYLILLMNFTLVIHLQKTNQWFLIPYLIWLLFALYLNYYIMINN